MKAEVMLTQTIIPVFSRFVVCLYFLNHAATQLQIWTYDPSQFPPGAFIILPAALVVAVNRGGVKYAGVVLLIIALWHSAETMLGQVWMWWVGYGLYINELMVKRLAVTGCMALLVAKNIVAEETLKQAAGSGVAGKLLEAMSPTEQMAKKRSGVLLVARLLMSLLFLFVGYGEIKRQLFPVVHNDGHGHSHTHKRPEGDGHDQVWAKLLQAALALPLSIGLRTKGVSGLLSVVCMLEALICWRFWSPESVQLRIGYVIHAREHFCVNVAVSGGLLILMGFGAGKYSMDAYLKKTE